MKYLIIILFIFSGFVASAQLPASTFPSRIFTGNTKESWTILDSPLVNPILDTFYARYPGTQIIRIQNSDTALWFFAGNRIWKRLGNFDSTSLSNRINLKLNISDTASMLSPYLRKTDTTNKWVQNVYARNDSLFKVKNGIETFVHVFPTSSSGTVTSVGISMPAAFTVSGSPITTSGIFNVSGAGTSSQYIRGDGTLATMDTSAIPNFFSKVRSEFSGTSPITYNSTTGAIGIQNATASGTKGAATFVNSSFFDNGSGTIDLANVVTAGGCITCNLSIDSKGRITSYANGQPPTIVNAPGAGDTLSTNDTIKRLFAGYGILHDVTQYNIVERVDTSLIQRLITVNNGLTKTGNNIQLGGSLIQATNITSSVGANRIIYSGVSSFGDGAQIDVSTSGSVGIAVRGQTVDGRGVLGVATTGVGVYGTATGSGGYGLFGLSTLGNAIYGRADSGLIWEGAMVPHSNNTIIAARSTTRASQALGANGIGYSDDSYLQTSTGSNRLSNQIIYKLTNATDASYASSFEFWNANNATVARKMAIAGNGQITLDQYTGSTFQTADTSFPALVVDGSGNVFKRAGDNGGGGSGAGIAYKYSSTALTGSDTSKYWIKTPSVAAVYNIYTFVNSKWERYGWLDSVTNVFSLKRPITVLICGQSNGVGVGTGGDTTAMDGIIAFSSDSIFSSGQDFQTKWIKARIGKSPFFTTGGIGANNIGFQVAKQIKKHADADIVRIILTGQGGTNLNAWISDGINPTFLLDTLRSRLNRSGIDSIDLFCWHQGESGGIRGFTFGGYVVDQRILYDTLCSTLTKGFFRNYTKYVAGGMADTSLAYILINRGSPEAAQEGLDYDGNYNTGFASAKGLTNVGDNIHFTGTALDTLGYRYYAAFKSLPHNTYQELPPQTWDSAFDHYMGYETLVEDYTGGPGAFKKIGAGFGWKTNTLNKLLTLSPSGTGLGPAVFIGETDGYTGNAMFRVNGRTIVGDGNFNTIISGGWNPTGGSASHNVVIGNYPSGNYNLADGSESVLIGYNMTNLGHMPNNSVVIGSEAGLNASPNGFGDFLTYIGRQAGGGAAGITQTFVGGRAGQNAQGSGLTAIGMDADAVNSTAHVNSTAIGNNAKYNEDSVFVAGNSIKRFIMGGTTSLPFLIGSPTNGQYFSWNNSNSQFELTSSTITTIYTGDGRFTANRTVSGANNNLKFDSIGNLQINADAYIFEKKNATFPYTAAIIGLDNSFRLGYTPVATVFSKGAGITIDSNNNASLGATQIPSTAPLYATGGSAYVSGLQNQAGTFNPVGTFTTGTNSIGLTLHFIQCDASSGNVTLNLPAASAAFAGSIGIEYIFFRTDNTGNTVTINRVGSDTINGATSFTIVGQYTAKRLQATSTSTWAQY